jgi:division protein CdvB (Snf7/Vps24/ESCRT-III family)
MAEAMNSTAQAMHKMNKAVNVTSITKMMAEFEKENAKTEMMQGEYNCRIQMNCGEIVWCLNITRVFC